MKSRLDKRDRELIKQLVTLLVTVIRHEQPDITPGEIYDAVAKELERRCQNIVERKSFDGATG